jgi:hypothetical protein
MRTRTRTPHETRAQHARRRQGQQWRGERGGGKEGSKKMAREEMVLVNMERETERERDTLWPKKDPGPSGWLIAIPGCSVCVCLVLKIRSSLLDYLVITLSPKIKN